MDNWEDGFGYVGGYEGEYFGGYTEDGQRIIILPNGDEARDYVARGTEEYPEYIEPEEETVILPVNEQYEYDDILGIKTIADESMLSTLEDVSIAEESSILDVDNEQEKEIIYRILGTTGGEDTIYSIDDVYSVLLDVRNELVNSNRHMTNLETFGYVMVALVSMLLGGMIVYGFFRRIL